MFCVCGAELRLSVVWGGVVSPRAALQRYLQLGVPDHDVAEDVEQNVGGGACPAAARVGRLDVDGEEVLVGEGLQLQEVELAFEVCNVAAHWRAGHTPPARQTAGALSDRQAHRQTKDWQDACGHSQGQWCMDTGRQNAVRAAFGHSQGNSTQGRVLQST